jgi:hypothetical protein
VCLNTPRDSLWLVTSDCMETAIPTSQGVASRHLLLRSDFLESRRTLYVILSERTLLLVSMTQLTISSHHSNLLNCNPQEVYSTVYFINPPNLYLLSARLGSTCKLCIKNLTSTIIFPSRSGILTSCGIGQSPPDTT